MSVGTTPIYRYYVAWTISGNLALELNFSGVQWSRQIRRAGTFTGTVAFSQDEDRQLQESYLATMPMLMSLYVTRNGQPVWGGFISKRNYDAATRTLQIEATGFEGYLYRRSIWTSLTFLNTTDEYQIVRQLIAYMQTDFNFLNYPTDRATPRPDNANLGIKVESRNAGRYQDTQVYNGWELKSVGEAIEAFSDNLYGFEYNIDIYWDSTTQKFIKRLLFRDAPPSQIPIGVIYTGTRPGLEENFFEFPGNVTTISYDDNIDSSCTRQWVVGATPDAPESTTDEDTEATPTAEDTTEQPAARGVWDNTAYLAAQWPLFDNVESSEHTSVSSEQTLDNYAAVYGSQSKPPAPAWTVTVSGGMNPEVGTYQPGDWCRLVVSDPFLVQAIDSSGTAARAVTKRIAAFTVTVPDTNQVAEDVSLTLIDEWNDDSEGGG